LFTAELAAIRKQLEDLQGEFNNAVESCAFYVS